MWTCRRISNAPSRSARASTRRGAGSSAQSARTWSCGATSSPPSPPPSAFARRTARSCTGTCYATSWAKTSLRSSNDREGTLDPVDLAVMDLAERVAVDATSITDADLQRLRDLGLTDGEIMDVVLTAAARCFFSKTLDALDVRRGREVPGPRARAQGGIRRRPAQSRRTRTRRAARREGACRRRPGSRSRAVPRTTRRGLPGR